MRVPLALFLPGLLGLGGCQLAERMDLQAELNGTADGGDDGGGGDGGDDDGGADGVPVLLSVEPPYGLTRGGDSVTLYGDGFGDVVEILFGEQPADLDASSDEQLTVTVPAQADEGWVDVSVRNRAGSSTLPQSFRYWQDASGQTGAIGYLQRVDYMASAGSYAGQSRVGAMIAVIEPTSFSWSSLYADGTDQCASNRSISSSLVKLDPGISAIELNSGATRLTLPWSSSQRSFTNGELDLDAFLFSASYDLPETDLGDLGTLSIEDVVQTPSSGLRVSSPDLDDMGIGTLFPLSLSWSGGQGEVVLIELQIYDVLGSSVQETITCVARDDGRFTIPTSVIQGETFLHTFVLAVSSTRNTTATLPFNNAELEILGIYTQVGIGRAL